MADSGEYRAEVSLIKNDKARFRAMKTAGVHISCEAALWGAFGHDHVVQWALVRSVQGFETFMEPQ